MDSITIHDKRKIIDRCVKQSYSMEQTAQFYNLPLWMVVDYISFFYKNKDEQRKMLTQREYENLHAKIIPNKFTGYFTEISEQDLENGITITEYDEVTGDTNQDDRSYEQRLKELVPDMTVVKELYPIKKKNNNETTTRKAYLKRQFYTRQTRKKGGMGS